MPEEPTCATIYVALLDEGVDCWRPVRAIRLGGGIFRISEQAVPEAERWEFRPGEAVRCEQYDFCEGRHLRAFAKAEENPSAGRR